MTLCSSLLLFFQIILVLAVAAASAEDSESQDAKNHKKRWVSLGGIGGGLEGHGLELGGGQHLGGQDIQAITITKKVPYPVPQPIPYPIVRHVPVPYKVSMTHISSLLNHMNYKKSFIVFFLFFRFQWRSQ